MITAGSFVRALREENAEQHTRDARNPRKVGASSCFSSLVRKSRHITEYSFHCHYELVIRTVTGRNYTRSRLKDTYAHSTLTDKNGEFSSVQTSVGKTTPCTAGAPTAMCRPKPPPIGPNHTFYGLLIPSRPFITRKIVADKNFKRTLR